MRYIPERHREFTCDTTLVIVPSKYSHTHCVSVLVLILITSWRPYTRK